MSLFHRLMTLKLTAGERDRPFPDVIPFNTVSTSSNRQHRKPHLILLPNLRSQAYLKSYLMQAAIAWNALPNSLQTITSPDSFRRALEELWHDSKYYTHSDPFSSQS